MYDFNTFLSGHPDKTNEETPELNKIINQMDITNMYRTLSQTLKNNTFSSQQPMELSPKLTTYKDTKQVLKIQEN